MSKFFTLIVLIRWTDELNDGFNVLSLNLVRA